MGSESHRPTVTQKEQWFVEFNVFKIYNDFLEMGPKAQNAWLEIRRGQHLEYLTGGLRNLGASFCVLDANRPWLCYWILHSVALLGESVGSKLENDTIDFLNRCQDKNGGYGGGPGQLPHLATTYAAVNTLVTVGGHEALSSINRDKLYEFLIRMKDTETGGFRMHDGGEIDVRACYTAVSLARILDILDFQLMQNAGDYILSCQTYEGGIGGEPGSEAHGGYTFCGLAAMILMEEAHRLDLNALTSWVVFRQGTERGFQGRTNKLVDGCYSYWQGGALALIHDHHHRRHSSTQRPPPPLFDVVALQHYILLCSQQLAGGGFRDKPGKHRDFYHTCYCLSGLSLTHSLSSSLLGPPSNFLHPVDPLFNVLLARSSRARHFFSNPIQ